MGSGSSSALLVLDMDSASLQGYAKTTLIFLFLLSAFDNIPVHGLALTNNESEERKLALAKRSEKNYAFVSST